MAPTEIQPNKITISYNRMRKFNPGMISSKFDYGSEEVGFGLWIQVDRDEDFEHHVKELKAKVNDEIEKELQETVMRLRQRAQARNYNWNAIQHAFNELMQSQDMSAEQINAGLERFVQLLEKYQAAETV